METLGKVRIESIINSLNDGVYVCDLNRQIVYWSESAARITGWNQKDVIGKSCSDEILNHIDKNGHELCGKEFCPLHRSMVTGKFSKVSQLVYAQGADGQRVPMEVTVAPICNDDGEVIGGVETFRDASDVVHDLERAKAIQQIAMEVDVPADTPLAYTTHYIPHGIVGGDFYAIKDLGDNRHGLMLADVMGHGIAAALYTMHLSSQWNRHHKLLAQPTDFLAKINHELTTVIKEEGSFATALCGTIDLNENIFRFASAGGPSVLLWHQDGTYECIKTSGLPLGIMPTFDYQEYTCPFKPGDSLLLFSDGAVEIRNAEGTMLGIQGLIEILKKQDYPNVPISVNTLERALLKYSDAICLEDDLTMIEVRFQTND